MAALVHVPAAVSLEVALSPQRLFLGWALRYGRDMFFMLLPKLKILYFI